MQIGLFGGGRGRREEEEGEEEEEEEKEEEEEEGERREGRWDKTKAMVGEARWVVRASVAGLGAKD